MQIILHYDPLLAIIPKRSYKIPNTNVQDIEKENLKGYGGMPKTFEHINILISAPVLCMFIANNEFWLESDTRETAAENTFLQFQ